jgi:hypothetical protein
LPLDATRPNILAVFEKELETSPVVGQLEIEHVWFLAEALGERCVVTLELHDQAAA